MIRKKINVAILMAALTVSMLAGCGSQKDKQENNNVSATENIPTETATEEATQEQEESETTNYPQITSDGKVKDYNSVVVVDDAAYELYTYLDDVAANYAKSINKVAKNLDGKADVYDLVIPLSSGITFPDNLRDEIKSSDQQEAMKKIQDKMSDKVKSVDVYDTLMQHREEYEYYRTDHHWTTLGAYYGYQALSKSMKLDTSKTSDMKPYAVTNAFNGTLASTSGYETGYEEPIYIYAPDNLKNATEAVVNNVNEKKKTATLYDTSKLKGKDKYALFLGGNYPILDIKTTADSTDRLLIIKDSYANSLIPFLIPYYREIVVVDPRYYYDDIEKVMKKDNITSVLFLYNGNTFVKDNSISGVLQND